MADEPDHQRYHVLLSTDDGDTTETDLDALDALDAINRVAADDTTPKPNDGWDGNTHATVTRAFARRVPE